MESKKNEKKVSVNVSDLEKVLAAIDQMTFDNVNKLLKSGKTSDARVCDGVYSDYGAYANRCYKAMLELVFNNGLDKDLLK